MSYQDLCAAVGAQADRELAAANAEIARLEALIRPPIPDPVPPGLLRMGSSTVVEVPGHPVVAVARTYLGTGQTPATYTADSGTRRAVGDATACVWVSFKNAPGPWLGSLLTSIEAEDLDVILTHNHEPENDNKTAAGIKAYHDNWDATVAIAADHPRTLTATVLMGSKTHAEWVTFFHPGVDLCGFDRYNPGIQKATAYVDPVEVFADVIEFADEVGLPLAIGETGVNIVKGDAAGRTAWAGRARTVLDDAGAVAACWWNQGLCVLDAPTAAAWLD